METNSTKSISIVLISLIVMLVELIAGYYTHSIVILADSFHFLSHALRQLICLRTSLISIRAKPRSLAFGYQNIEPFAMFFYLLMNWLIYIHICIEAVQRIIERSIVQAPICMFLTSLLGLACKLYLLKMVNRETFDGQQQQCQMQQIKNGLYPMQKGGRSSLKRARSKIGLIKSVENSSQCQDRLLQNRGPNIQGSNSQNYSNNMGTTNNPSTEIILSVGVVTSAFVVYYCASPQTWSYWQLADPISTLFLSAIVISSTLPAFQYSSLLLLNGCSNTQLLQEVESELREDKRVMEIESLKLWQRGKGKLYGAVRLRVHKGSRAGLTNIFRGRNIDGVVHFLEEGQQSFRN